MTIEKLKEQVYDRRMHRDAKWMPPVLVADIEALIKVAEAAKDVLNSPWVEPRHHQSHGCLCLPGDGCLIAILEHALAALEGEE